MKRRTSRIERRSSTVQEKTMARSLSRRRFFSESSAGLAAGAAILGQSTGQQPAESRQATGVKVGEVTDQSAIVWMRLTANATRNNGGRAIPRGPAIDLPGDVQLADLQGACPGAAGRLRLRYGTSEDLRDARTTEWRDAVPRSDFSTQFRLAELRPRTVYHYAAETEGQGGAHTPLRGQFRTAPAADDDAPVTFAALSCSVYRDLDHPQGYHVYAAMARLRPDFFIHTGDNIYLDSDDFMGNSIERARHHWHRMHSLPRHVALCLQTPGYWEKDDHDGYADDCWPGKRYPKMEPLTFPEGLSIFREQVPMGERTYRTIRWGKGLQIWLTEGRDFRSPNTMADGPDKTIWGREQRDWLMTGLRESRADVKVLISPTPLVGPDRLNKHDNHSNAAFRHEGDLFRRFTREIPGRFFVVCGDRHWQYHSVHPEPR
jgi:alkaline phosphatase D